MAAEIKLNIIPELKAGTNKLEETITNSKLPTDKKNIAMAQLTDVRNVLSKNIDITAKDFAHISSVLKNIINELVKSVAGEKGVSKELLSLQKKLETAAQTKSTLKSERGVLTRSKLKLDDKGNYNLRTAEANRLTVASNVVNEKGDPIKSYQALQNAALKGNQAAIDAINKIEEAFEVYANRVKELDTILIPNAEAEVKDISGEIKTLGKEGDPTQSMSVQIQELGNELQNMIDAAKAEVDKIKSKPEDANDQGVVNVKEDVETIKGRNQELSKQPSLVGKAVKQFTLYAIIMRTIKSAAKEAVSTVKDLDSSLTEQAMVTGKTREQTYALLKSYQDLAGQLGATTKEVAEIATQYMRQGKTVSDALVLTEAAISAAKVAGISAADSINYLTTALNGFQLSANEAMDVSDKFAATAANSATSYDEIATALSKVASQANLAGMSIDYTTALLAKGLETTREAPETIGTALKTIIARMRELSDYGETLGDGTDINNVESQLAYVGIALRDQNGELRSTEEVLDELGKKWDTLNSNQQAAVAKALAGTRQQSRLIAMMTDYERVIELQEISQRSQGATLTQMNTYLQGMSASLNKVQVGWEKIVTNIVDNEKIINGVSLIGDLLDTVGDFLSTDFGLVSTLTTIVTLSAVSLGNKLNEIAIQKQQQKINQAIQQDQAKEKVLQQQITVATAETAAKKQETLVAEKKSLKTTLEKKKAEGEILTAQEESWLAIADQDIKDEEFKLDNLNKQLEIENQKLSLYDSQSKALENQGTILGTLKNSATGFLSVLSGVFGAYKTIAGAIGLVTKAKKKDAAQTEVNNAVETKNSIISSAASVAKNPFWGWAIALTLLAAAGVAIGISTAIKKNANNAENAANKINDLSAEIYKLNSLVTTLDSAVNKFDELDSKIIKTKEDIEAMNEALNSAADSLSSDAKNNTVDFLGNQSEQEYYNSLSSNAQKQEFINQVRAAANNKIKADRQSILQRVNGLSAYERDQLLNNSKYSTSKAAIYSINNSLLYESVDKLKEQGKLTSSQASAVENLTQSILEEVSAVEALNYANNPSKIEKLIDTISDLNMVIEVNGKLERLNTSQILNSSTYALKDQVAAYKQIKESLVANKVAYNSFVDTYQQYDVFERMGNDVLDFIDKIGLSFDDLNELWNGYEKLRKAGIDITKEDYQSKYENMLISLTNNGGDIAQSIKEIFNSYLKNFKEGSEEWITAWNALVNNFGDLVQVGILNMGQNIDSLKNTINNFYDKAVNWGTLSESEKTAFIQDNYDLFSGASGGDLLKAFESGNYNRIENALSSNEKLLERIEQRYKEIQQELNIELAREGDAYNAAYIRQLEEYAEYLSNYDQLFSASLETRLAQEESELEKYKDLLQKRADAEEESLNKRKEAYQKYFEEINQSAEDEDYEEKANLLAANLSKIASSTDANSVKQQKDLEQQLRDLEEERLQTLRERAQEQVLTNIDNQISQISSQLDEIINNNQALLIAMTQDLSSPSDFFAKMVASQVNGGTTALGIDNFIKELQSTYGSILDLNWGNFGETKTDAQGNIILNISGQEITLPQNDQQNMYQIIMSALRQIGVR